MVLEQFIIDADIIWDQVGKTFFENPEAKPGRIMRVQVVNAGIIEDLTGYTLNLGWTSVRDPSKFGLDAFDDVDITKGSFEIEYTSGMLTNIGPLNASLQLVPPGEGRPIESNNFKLTVKNSAINPEAIQGETSFKALENALVEVNGWNARIDVVEQEFKDRADALDEAYPVRLTAAEQKLVQILAMQTGLLSFKGSDTTVNINAKTSMVTGDYWYSTDGLTYYAYTGSAWANVGSSLTELVNERVDSFGITHATASARHSFTEKLNSKYCVNHFDENTLTSGFIYNGNISASADWKYTGHIPVEKHDHIYVALTNGKNLPTVSLFDANDNYIRQIYSSTVSADKVAYDFYVTDDNVAYAIYNVIPTVYLPYSKQYIIVDKAGYLRDNLQELNVASENETYYVGANRVGLNTFTTIKSCTEYIADNDVFNATVYVDSGTYDLETEYGLTYLNAIVSETNVGFGPHVGNNTHYIFSEGAKVVFDYSGPNEDCAEFFSAFNITGSVILENADIEVSNCRYCVHEDLPSVVDTLPDQYTVKYIDCIMEHKGNTIGSYTGTLCIGGGTNKNSLSVVDGGRYTCSNQYPHAISYHNYYGSFTSRLIFKNVWVNNDIRLANFGTNPVDVTISGCRFPNTYTPGSYFTVKEWGTVKV